MTSEAKERRGWARWNACAAHMTETDRRNLNRFNLWGVLWMAAFVAAALTLDAGAVPPGPSAWAVAIAPSLLGVVAIWCYIRFLRQADELLRKIQLEGLALGFGVGLVAMMGYRLLERAGAPDLDINDALLPMVLAWVIGAWLGIRRYS